MCTPVLSFIGWPSLFGPPIGSCGFAPINGLNMSRTKKQMKKPMYWVDFFVSAA
jgi:hypothetical protein